MADLEDPMGGVPTGPIADLFMSDPPRQDREETYIAILISLGFSGLGIYLLPIGTGAVATLDPSTQRLLAVSMMMGTTMALLGSCLGPRNLKITWPMRTIIPLITRRPFTPLPLRHCYRIGAAGLIACCSSLFFFTGTLINVGNLVGTFTGLMSPLLFGFWTAKCIRLIREARRMDRDYDQVVREIKDNGHGH